MDKSGIFEKPIGSEITQDVVFYKAEDYHQEYSDNFIGQPYCSIIIYPKL